MLTNLKPVRYTVSVISPNFLMWQFCRKAPFLHSFRQFTQNYTETVPFPQNFHTKKLGEITVFHLKKKHMVQSIWHTYDHVLLFFLLTVTNSQKNSNHIIFTFSLMFLCLRNYMRAIRKTQILSSCVKKCAKVTKSHLKTACFHNHMSVLNHAFTP